MFFFVICYHDAWLIRCICMLWPNGKIYLLHTWRTFLLAFKFFRIIFFLRMNFSCSSCSNYMCFFREILEHFARTSVCVCVSFHYNYNCAASEKKNVQFFFLAINNKFGLQRLLGFLHLFH